MRCREYFWPEDDVIAAGNLNQSEFTTKKGRKENSSKVKAVQKDTMDEKWIESFEALVNTPQAWKRGQQLESSHCFLIKNACRQTCVGAKDGGTVKWSTFPWCPAGRAFAPWQWLGAVLQSSDLFFTLLISYSFEIWGTFLTIAT